MSREADISAIASWDRSEAPDPGRSNGQPVKYRCLACDWRGKGSIARADHHRDTGHVVVNADDPRFVRNVPGAPYAEFAFMQPDFKGGEFALYTVVGGPRHRSTLSAETLRQLGIPVRGEK